MIKKYIVRHRKGIVSILQVGCQKIFSSSNEKGEKYLITSPSSILENGKPIVYYSFGVFDTEALAINSVAGDIRVDLERTAAKNKQNISEEELTHQIADKISKVKIISLGEQDNA